MNRFKYFIDGIKHMKTRGTVAPTSRFTSKQMLKPINFEQTDHILELGAGDGSITKHILRRMEPHATLFSIELNDDFCKELNDLGDPRLKVLNTSAEKMVEALSAYNLSKVDYVISGLPLVNMPKKITLDILSKAKSLLKPNGYFIQFHYSLIPKKLYLQTFDEVDIRFEVRNIPPAFVFVCK